MSVARHVFSALVAVLLSCGLLGDVWADRPENPVPSTSQESGRIPSFLQRNVNHTVNQSPDVFGYESHGDGIHTSDMSQGGLALSDSAAVSLGPVSLAEVPDMPLFVVHPGSSSESAAFANISGGSTSLNGTIPPQVVTTSSCNDRVLYNYPSVKFTCEHGGSVVLVRAYYFPFAFYHPHLPQPPEERTGSGFAAGILGENGNSSHVPIDVTSNPVFVTNSGVVMDAFKVTIELPTVDQTRYDAHVSAMYDHEGLALLRLDEPQLFLQATKDRFKILRVNPDPENPIRMGQRVASLGFPLEKISSGSLKYSSGELAGWANFQSRFVLQSTAPTSAGSHGGPLVLLDGDSPRVIGVTVGIDSQHGAQNVNYAVPVQKVRQLLKYDKLQDQGRTAYTRLRVAPLRAVGVEEVDDDTVRKGCTGILISKVRPLSVLLLKDLEPPFFLQTVDGTKLDSFGNGRSKHFFDMPLKWEHLLMMREDETTSAKVQVCRTKAQSNDTQVQTMDVPLEFNPLRHEPKVPFIVEPSRQFKKQKEDFMLWDTFAGIVLMELTGDHVLRAPDPELMFYLLPEHRTKPRLMLIDLTPGSYASEVLRPGLLVDKVNGKPVTDLATYHGALVPDDIKGTWSVEFTNGVKFEVMFEDALKVSVAQAMMGGTQFGQYAGSKFFKVMLQSLQSNTATVSAPLEGPPAWKTAATHLSELVKTLIRPPVQPQSPDDPSAEDHSTASFLHPGKVSPAAVQGPTASSFDPQNSVVRITCTELTWNWFYPHIQETFPRVATGSGFAVELELDDKNEAWKPSSIVGPVFVTNAHVVRNGATIEVQLPSVSDRRFEAYVRLIFEDMDLAVVLLKDPSSFPKELRALPVSSKDRPLVLGVKVMALGFPLGAPSVQQSTGVISGTHEMKGQVKFQMTAPISPGSSGGPLFVLEGLEETETPPVIGVNFASATQGQNNNYAIPLVHVRQLLHGLKSSLEDLSLPTHAHATLRMPPLNTVVVQASDGLRYIKGNAQKCTTGVYISDIKQPSVLYGKVQNGSFLVSVNDVSLDNYGRGRVKEYLNNLLNWDSIVHSARKLNGVVKLKYCFAGEDAKEVSIDMNWNDVYELKVPTIGEPHWHKELKDTVTQGDVTFMQMTYGHVEQIVQASADPRIVQYMRLENRRDPRVMVVYTEPGSRAGRVLNQGDVVVKINDVSVGTLQEVRTALSETGGPTWSVEVESGVIAYLHRTHSGSNSHTDININISVVQGR